MTVKEYVNERIEIALNDLNEQYGVKYSRDKGNYILSWANGYECFNDFYEYCETDIVDSAFAYEEYEVESSEIEIEKVLLTYKEYLKDCYNEVMEKRKPYEI